MYGTAVYSDDPTFIETRLFTRLIQGYMTDDEYARLQAHLVSDPEAGVVIPGSGAVRKLRWPGSGKGKRGGDRVVYFARKLSGIIWMITIYPKNVADNIPAGVLKRIREEIESA